MRLIAIIFLLLFIAAGIVFGALNADLVPFDLGFAQLSLPKGGAMLAAVLVGWVLGGITALAGYVVRAPATPARSRRSQGSQRDDRMNPIWLLALVPPLAFACGWWLARRSHVRRSGERVNELSSDYFRGLNYLLNEEQDKALEVFLRLAEYNRDTVETHLALGNLFRKRGEVDRAIRLHQHLVSRQGLSDEMKTVALLELGEDYMRAGLLDRAETLFSDLVAMDALAPSALRHLIAIYQHEREWHKAIDHARRTGDHDR